MNEGKSKPKMIEETDCMEHSYTVGETKGAKDQTVANSQKIKCMDAKKGKHRQTEKTATLEMFIILLCI